MQSLQNLEILVLDDNIIALLPDSIVALSKLKACNTYIHIYIHTYIPGSTLADIDNRQSPIGIQRCPSPQVLSANRNELWTLPSGMDRLTSLVDMSVAYNNLTYIPCQIFGVCS